MVNISLEKKLLGSMVHDPDLAQRYLIKKEWFSDEQTQQVADVLIHSDREFEDIAEISSDVRKQYPQSTINDEWLQAVSFESMYVQSFKASLKTLQREYLDNKAQEAGLDYAEYRTEKYRKQLEDALKELNDLETNDDEELLEEPLNELMDEMENGREPGVKTFSQLDRLLGLGIENANLFVIGGRPGTGKTAYAINLVLEALRHQDMVIDFFTLEMTNLQMLKRFMSNLSMINSYKLRDTSMLPDEDKQKLIFHSDWLYKQDIQIHSKKSKLSDIRSTIIQRSEEAGDKKYIAVIDYLQLMDAENPYAKRNEQVGQVSRELKQLTNKQNIPIIALSQLNRGIENRQDKTPSLADLRESGDIEQDANNIGFLYLDDEDDSDSQQVQIRFNIAKQRDGKTGTIDYYFDKGLMTFKEVE